VLLQYTAVAAAEELRKRGRVRKLAPSDGWQTAPTAVARRVAEDEQEDAAEDECVVQEEGQEEDLSGEEADSAGPEHLSPAGDVRPATACIRQDKADQNA
jgi:hypothetical protein